MKHETLHFSTPSVPASRSRRSESGRRFVAVLPLAGVLVQVVPAVVAVGRRAAAAAAAALSYL